MRRTSFSLQLPKFLSWRSRGFIRNALGDNIDLPSDPPLSFLYSTYSGPKFAHDARHRLWEGATGDLYCDAASFSHGVQASYMIGVDHNFTTKGKPNTTVVSQGADPDHFDSNYFGKGFRWQLPDLETSRGCLPDGSSELCRCRPRDS